MRRPDPGRGRAVRLLAAPALIALLAALAAGPLGGAPAAADEGDATAVLDSLEPLVLAQDGTLRLSGRVTAAAELSDVTVQLRASATPAASRAELGVLDGGAVPARREGSAVSGTSRVVADRLAEGDQAPFELEVPAARLPFSKAGAYPIAVEVRGTVAGDRGRVATVRTTVPWWPAGTRAAPTPLAVVWPLIDEPRRDPEGVFTAEGADALAESLAPGGRLARLVQAAEGAPVAWIVDPELLGAAFELSAGAVVRDGDGTTTRPADPDARSWIAAVSRTAKQPAAGGWLAVVPYADPDVAAVVRAGLSADLVTASARGAALGRLVLGVETPAAPGWPDGGAPEEALAAIAGAGTRTVLLDAASYPPRAPTTATPAAVAVLPPSAGTATALLGDPQLTAVAARDASAPGVLVTARQRLLAETLVITLERPSDPRPQVLLPPRRFAPTAEWAAQLMRAVRETPWTAPTALQALAPDGSDGVPRRGPLYPPAAADAEISPSQLDDIRAGQDQLAALDAILERPGPRSDAATAALLRGQSTAWRDEPAAGAAYAKATRASIEQAARGVSILEPGSVTLAGQSGKIPITVSNTLDQPVTVRLALTANPSVRLALTDPGEIRVEAGRSASVAIEAEAAASGKVVVAAQLLTPEGAPYGPAEAFDVQVRAIGTVAGYLMGGLLALLFVATVLRIVKRARMSRAGSGPLADDADAAAAEGASG